MTIKFLLHIIESHLTTWAYWPHVPKGLLGPMGAWGPDPRAVGRPVGRTGGWTGGRTGRRSGGWTGGRSGSRMGGRAVGQAGGFKCLLMF